jgi:iron uptake system component EfeO
MYSRQMYSRQMYSRQMYSRQMYSRTGSAAGMALGATLLCMTLLVAALVTGPVAAQPASVGDGIEQYRSRLVADIDRALASARTLRASAAAGDVAGARQAWIEARVGWERSEVFTTPFAPELDRDIDAWPDGATGFHAIEAKLFGAGRTDFDNEADRLVRNLDELDAKARNTPLTPQGLLDGIVRLAYEVGGSKVDGGESRVSGTSLNDMRNNVDGIALAWRTIFAAAVEARDQPLDAHVRRGIEGLKTMVDVRDLRRIDPDRLRTATEELVLRLQNAAPLLDLSKPALEADAR